MGFFADGKLKRIDIRGGLSQTLSDAGVAAGGTWGADGTICCAIEWQPVVPRPSFRRTGRAGHVA